MKNATKTQAPKVSALCLYYDFKIMMLEQGPACIVYYPNSFTNGIQADDLSHAYAIVNDIRAGKISKLIPDGLCCRLDKSYRLNTTATYSKGDSRFVLSWTVDKNKIVTVKEYNKAGLVVRYNVGIIEASRFINSLEKDGYTLSKATF